MDGASIPSYQISQGKKKQEKQTPPPTEKKYQNEIFVNFLFKNDQK